MRSSLVVAVGGGVAAGLYLAEQRHKPISLCARTGFRNLTLDHANSKLNVWTWKQGILAPMGHNLCLRAESLEAQVKFDPKNPLDSAELWLDVDPAKIVVEGRFTESERGVELTRVDNWTCGQILGNMRGSKILDVAHFPSIAYHAKVRRDKQSSAGSGLNFDGVLSLHGQQHPLPMTADILLEEAGRMVIRGEVMFRQSDWGVKPLSRGFGALALQDKVRVSFTVQCNIVSKLKR
eukprot:NODE_3874_length_901_cov_28.940141_g3567_i0.p1 GENE.NODE_3874_length_901_cov_28.940141_g3567_i0~~NODE_3874_length_901_cov_28.940141_g3567_i0.p1  ORF type:complete len:236 (+),score=46.09 NODE_3874_length_901_cov_28.940141_g3567_i0:61-768(+)